MQHKPRCDVDRDAVQPRAARGVVLPSKNGWVNEDRSCPCSWRLARPTSPHGVGKMVCLSPAPVPTELSRMSTPSLSPGRVDIRARTRRCCAPRVVLLAAEGLNEPRSPSGSGCTGQERAVVLCLGDKFQIQALDRTAPIPRVLRAGTGTVCRAAIYRVTGLSRLMVVLEWLTPLAVVTVRARVTVSCAPPRSALIADLGSFTVKWTVVPPVTFARSSARPRSSSAPCACWWWLARGK